MGIKERLKEDKNHAGHKDNGTYQQVFRRINEIEIVHNCIYIGSNIDDNRSCVSDIR